MLLTLILSSLCVAAIGQQLDCPGIPFVSKTAWGATAVRYSADRLTFPVTNVISHATSGTTCNSVTTCSQVMRTIQATHLSSNFHDIGYHFVVSVDGNVYEGRGWFQRAALEENKNQVSFSFAYIGTQQPTAAMTNLMARLVNCGKGRNYIGPSVAITPSATTDLFQQQSSQNSNANNNNNNNNGNNNNGRLGDYAYEYNDYSGNSGNNYNYNYDYSNNGNNYDYNNYGNNRQVSRGGVSRGRTTRLPVQQEVQNSRRNQQKVVQPVLVACPQGFGPGFANDGTFQRCIRVQTTTVNSRG
ncbi:Peptidoglycan recognition protein 4 [Halotydeus destructor]|nr:Peptidoglycan recognition protein 4 [Halotydeus destructor]